MTDKPFVTRIIPEEFRLDGADSPSITTMKDMASIFLSKSIAASMQDRVVYRVTKRSVPLESGELLQCITEILPGDCNGELFMTKGHGHSNSACAEIYLGIAGKGLVLIQRGNEFQAIELEKYKAVYIPGGWNHRTVNVSSEEPFVFYSIWPAQSGYDYEAIVRKPFSKRVFRDGSGYKLVGVP
jgi:glucose-6-phosphate isomerase